MFNLFLSILSGILLALSFPKPEFSFLAWFGFIFLFFSIKKLTSYRKAFLFSYLCGLIFFSIVIYWIVYVTFIGSLVLVIYLALYFGAFGLGVKWIENNFNNNLFKILLIASLWTALEFARSYLFTGFGWALLGYSQYRLTKLIQIADITGAYGLSFLVIFVNVTLFYLLKLKSAVIDITKKRLLFIQYGMPVLLILILFFICASYGEVKIKKFKVSRKELLKISVIQGNITQEMKWDEVMVNLILNKYEKLTRMAAFDKPDIIIWPETSLPGYLNDEELKARVGKMAASLSTPLLIGAPRFSRNPDKYFNSTAFFDKTGTLTKTYNKLHLVPFGEYMPLGRLFSPLLKLYPIAGFSAGEDYILFEVNGVTFGSLICFEDVFPDLVRTFVKEGADFMVNMTNDAWFKRSPAAYQHNQALVFRAVENKISIVRVGNTGPSLFIEPTGRIEPRLINQHNQDLFIDGFLTAKVKKGLKTTFFTKFGNIFAYICVGLFGGTFLWKVASSSKKN
jgi:apolipoprotein N-acyltransferase